MEYLKLLFLSMVPIIELRGAIPIGIAMDLNPIYLYIICVIGSSIISVPVVLMFRQIIDFLRYRKYFNKVIRWIDKKIEGRAKKLKAASIVVISFFVELYHCSVYIKHDHSNNLLVKMFTIFSHYYYI